MRFFSKRNLGGVGILIALLLWVGWGTSNLISFNDEPLEMGFERPTAEMFVEKDVETGTLEKRITTPEQEKIIIKLIVLVAIGVCVYLIKDLVVYLVRK